MLTFICHSVQFSLVTQSCPTLCDPINRSTPGLPVHHQLPEFTQTHVHRVSDAIQPSHHLSFPSPPAPNPSQHQGLFQWVNSSHMSLGNCKLKLSWDIITHLSEWLKYKTLTTPNADKDVEQQNSHSLLVECKMAQPLWKTVWQFLTKPIAHSVLKVTKNYVHTKICTQMFIAALFITIKIWKQPRCPSIGKCIKNWYIHVMKYYSKIKRDKWSGHKKIWRKIRWILLSEKWLCKVYRLYDWHSFLNICFIFYSCWVFVAVCRLSLVAESGSTLQMTCTGFSLLWLLLLWSTGSGVLGLQ